MRWDARLIRPIQVEEGDLIVTLSDAREYLLKLPKNRQNDPTVQATVEALLMAAEGRGRIYTAQAGVAQVVGRCATDYDPNRPRTPAKKWRRQR